MKTRNNHFSLLYITILFVVCDCIAITTSSSSVLSNDHRYSPGNVIDGNFQTAWVEGDSGDGSGEWIMLDFGKIMNLQYIGFIIGYNKNDQIWQQNNSIKSAELFFTDSSIKKISFFKIQRTQYFEINKETSYVKFKITSVYKGSKYNDACISEIKPVFTNNIKFIDSAAYSEKEKSYNYKFMYFTHYDFNVYPFEIKFTEGLTSYFGDIAKIEKRNVTLKDSVYHFGTFNLDFQKIIKFSLSSSEANLISVEKRIDYRHIVSYGDAGYYNWLEDGLENKPPLGIINDELSHYSSWEKLIPVNNLYSVFNNNINSKLCFAIDSMDIAVPANKEIEDEAGRRLYANIVKQECPACNSWEKENRKCYAIHSVQFKINYLKDSVEKHFYIILYKSYGH